MRQLKDRVKKRPRRIRVLEPTLDWKPIPECAGLANPAAGCAILHVENQVRSGRAFRDQYDQPLFVENPGSILVATFGERVGLIRNYRLTEARPLICGTDEDASVNLVRDASAIPKGQRPLPEDNGRGYVASLLRNRLFGQAVEGLGRWVWEAPRGIAPVRLETDARRLFEDIARVEGAEEAGFELCDVEICGSVNPNTTYFAHAQSVVRARIRTFDDHARESSETIGGIRLFTGREIRDLIVKGEFICGMTISALAIAGFRF